MVTFNIPHTADYIPTANIFTASFSDPTLGKYNFDVDGNRNQVVCELQGNSIYMIARMSIGGDIGEEIYSNSIEIIPAVTLRRKRNNVLVYPDEIKIVGYSPAQEVITFIYSDQKGERIDQLLISCTGLLKQTVDTVGREKIGLNITFEIYKISSVDWIQEFRNQKLSFKRPI